MDIFSSFS
jgi:hypothetical protein